MSTAAPTTRSRHGLSKVTCDLAMSLDGYESTAPTRSAWRISSSNSARSCVDQPQRVHRNGSTPEPRFQGRILSRAGPPSPEPAPAPAPFLPVATFAARAGWLSAPVRRQPKARGRPDARGVAPVDPLNRLAGELKLVDELCGVVDAARFQVAEGQGFCSRLVQQRNQLSLAPVNYRGHGQKGTRRSCSHALPCAAAPLGDAMRTPPFWFA
jgi:hypothetical protein